MIIFSPSTSLRKGPKPVKLTKTYTAMIKAKKIQDRVQEKEDSADKQISIYKLPGTKTKLDSSQITMCTKSTK